MRDEVLRALKALVLLTGLSACSPAPSPNPPTVILSGTEPTSSAPPPVFVDAGVPHKTDAGTIAWMGSEPEARALARRAGRPMLVWIRADWDAATLEMERRVWTDPAVIAKVRPFVPLRLDMTETEGTPELYAQQFDVQGLPTTIVLDASGKRVATVVGYRDAATVLDALRAASED